ncbi:hypothetical protein BS47DRAFT_1383960 [Hydnum rufescens UP504]|uniref:Multifunctional tryptophan biosynthesis protein n=1 Tax=Hydnum rufescens UP504 TaxID=1448309 RepID=A0A9P6AR85_9AGAM|nr:hypothetical protein BS47DRAFT_1383960 [Hydnum rufescens UP504]
MAELETLLIDNFDSFTWNLYQSLSNLGANVRVIRNDALTPEDFPNLQIKNLIISPGPGHPKTDSGISRDAIRYFAGTVPVLGVCMGLECFVDVYGGEIAYAGEIMHGKTSPVQHDGKGIFKGVPQGISSTRYHSLSASIKSLPAELAVTATSRESGVIMGVRHRKFTVESVQYHPESIMSEGGDAILKNFLQLNGGTWSENPEFGVTEADEPEALPPAAEKPPTILEKIYAQRYKDIELSKATPGTTPADLATLLSLHVAPPLIPFLPRLSQRVPALMAEIKRASPSKGNISLTINAAQQALTYALAGASVISVLTEPTWFKGSLLDMRVVRDVIDSLPNRPAILRKDFILDEYQILEARLHGADTVLLIVAMLTPQRLQELYAYSISLGMEPLVEVNNAKEMETALNLGAKVIGVNNRNLHDFSVDMGNSSRLAGMSKDHDVVLCALSGISSPEDVRNYVEQGVRAVLVGESLMRAADPTTFIHKLLDLPSETVSESSPLVKICGIRSVEDALQTAQAGADLIGMVFAPNSRRAVDIPTAHSIVSSIRSHINAPASSPTPLNSSNLPWFSHNAQRTAQRIKSAGRPLVVGVFQSQPLEDILHIVAASQIDLVQLHGNEPLSWARQIPVPIIQVFHVPTISSSEEKDKQGGGGSGRGLAEIARPGFNQFVLLDAVRPGGGNLSGGAGVAFDWDVAREIVVAGESQVTGARTPPMPIILAGGLTAENVREAVEKVRPWAVDVSGGVETDGVKDLDKIRAFISAAKSSIP